MLSNKQEKLIRSLQKKKFRKQYRLFTVEGRKSVDELLDSELEIEEIYGTSEELSILNDFKTQNIPLIEIDDRQIKRMSSMYTAPGLLALVRIPDEKEDRSDLMLYLDGVSDPGNMGTIIRTAEGFGVKQIYLSDQCVDLFSPKVVQATMGSLFRMNYLQTDIETLHSRLGSDCEFYAADMGGEKLYEADLKLPALLIVGGEANGLSLASRALDPQFLGIPIDQKLESLNVAISTAIVLSEFRRRFPL